MGEQGRALMMPVLALQPQRRAQQGIAAGGVHHVVGAQLRLAAVAARRRALTPSAREIDAQHLRVLEGLRAAGAGVVEQQLIELLRGGYARRSRCRD